MAVHIDELPVEVCDHILQLLSITDLKKMRLASRSWDAFCRPKIWENVRVGYSNTCNLDNYVDKFGMIYFTPFSPRVSGIGYRMLLCLSEIKQFQTALALTKKLYIFDDKDDWFIFENQPYEAMARLFTNLRTVYIELTCYSCRRWREEYQRMLDQWKPTVEFCLDTREFDHYDMGKQLIEVHGMKITKLHLRYQDTCPHLQQLKLNGESLLYPELPTISDHLTTLLLEIKSATIDWPVRVPDTVRILHLRNEYRKIRGAIQHITKLVVPAGVEYLHVEQDHDIDIGGISLFECLDLTNATGLKSMTFDGLIPESSPLVNAVLQVEGSLEYLAIEVPSEADCDFSFSSIAHAVLGLKQLRLSMKVLETRPSHYSFVVDLPNLNYLRLEMWGIRESPDPDLFCESFISECLHSCPKLSCLELMIPDTKYEPLLDKAPCSIEWDQLERERPWITKHTYTPTPFYKVFIYRVDIAQARQLLIDHCTATK